MCCHNRRPPSGRRRHQPAIITLGQFAYKKYQERKQQQRPGASNAEAERHASPPAGFLQGNANSEILEKSGIAPPRYDDVVGAPADTDDGLQRGEKVDDDDELSDAESFFERDAQGERRTSAEMEAAQAAFIRKWRAHRDGKAETAMLTKGEQGRV